MVLEALEVVVSLIEIFLLTRGKKVKTAVLNVGELKFVGFERHLFLKKFDSDP